MDRKKMVIMMMTLMGLFMSLSGFLLSFYFNFNYPSTSLLNHIVKYVGVGAGLFILFIGLHILIVGITSLRS